MILWLLLSSANVHLQEEDVKAEVPEVKEDRQTGFSDAPPAGLPEAPPRESGFSDAPADAPATGFSSIPPANYSAAAQAAEYGGNPGGIGPQPGIAGQFTDVVEIPAGMVGKLIGKAGETIKNLQHSTGTKVQIDHQAPGDKKPVSISLAHVALKLPCRAKVVWPWHQCAEA